jgi:hypothetical protein
MMNVTKISSYCIAHIYPQRDPTTYIVIARGFDNRAADFVPRTFESASAEDAMLAVRGYLFCGADAVEFSYRAGEYSTVETWKADHAEAS